MKAIITITIADKTTPETLEELGLSEKFMGIMYREAFGTLLKQITTHEQETTVAVQIEDNTKEAPAENGV